MTLCTSWIRKENENEELIFATDSTLTGGEKWNSGVKLFELPRKDCLICFAGHTYRAYPMILNLISELRSRMEMQNHHVDISEVAGFIEELFANLIKNLIPETGKDTLDSLAAEASFLFGGWSWRENRFRIWKIVYKKDAKGFLAEEQTAEKDNHRIAIFLGNPEELGTRAEAMYQQRMIDLGKFHKNIDMEPAMILAELSKDGEIREIDGAPQIGKVFRSGTAQFFGIRWQSSKGNPTFLGREFTEQTKPKVRFFNPDTFELLEEELPIRIPDINVFSSSPDFLFIKDCYELDEEASEYFLSDEITDVGRARLIRIFTDITYSSFLSTYNEQEVK